MASKSTTSKPELIEHTLVPKHTKISDKDKKELLNKYSVKDVLLHLSKIYKIKINNEEILSEVPKQTKTLIDKLNLHIT